MTFGKANAAFRSRKKLCHRYMSRKKRNSIVDVIPPIGAMLVAGYFIPAVRPALWCLLAIGFLAAFVFAALWIIKIKRNSNKTIWHASISDPPNSNLKQAEIRPTVERLSEKLHKIDWFQFEKLVGVIYQAKGYAVTRIGGANPDGGVDLFIEREGVKSVVQCKHWRTSVVGVKPIREFLGTLTDVQVRSGIFITLKGYTNEARDLAAKHNIELLGEAEFVRLIEALDLNRKREVNLFLDEVKKDCPKCNHQMVLRTNKGGRNPGRQFWGCSTFPRCKTTLSI